MCSDPLDAYVHSVFRRVVNLYCPADDQLYTLAAGTTDDAPCTVVVDVQSFDGFKVQPRARVRFSRGRLIVESCFEIVLGRARSWSPLLPPVRPLPAALEWVERFHLREGIAGGIKPGQDLDPIAAEMSRLLAAGVTGLCRALADGDTDSAYEHGSRLVGLGPGLTPAGDDFLVGLAAACAMRGARARGHAQLLLRVVKDNAHRTNRISYTAMTQAATRRVRDSIIRFAQALAGGDFSTLRPCAERVIAIGATSGTDIMAGMLAGLRLDRVK
jgi:hypothetical protein